jgi:hypothetical protein
MSKKLTAAALSGLIVAGSTTAALADGPATYVAPVVMPELIIEDTSSSAAGVIVPLMLILLIAAAIATGGDPV